MTLPRRPAILGLAALLSVAPVVPAQRKPDIGYVYPAGGQPGTTIELKLAGQYLDGVTNVVFSGDGIEATVIEYVKPLNGKQINLLRDRMLALQKGIRSAKRGDPTISVRSELDTNVVLQVARADAEKEIAEIRSKLANPKNRARDNPQLSEDVTLRAVLAPDATPGERDLRLRTALGLSNPIGFHVDRLPGHLEREPNNRLADAERVAELPVVINGQILPGDVDRFRLSLRHGARLVVVVSARALIPYLADAVPGWFQATLALGDPKGTELAYADDYRFNPDPVLSYEIPKDGEYLLEIKDAIYRGREDFVYRIAVGELPFVTSLFPLGGRAGVPSTVNLKGWNLPTNTLTVETKGDDPGVVPISLRKADLVSNEMPFAVDKLPERLEREPNNEEAGAQAVTLPMIVNGRIDQPGDTDVFRLDGRAGDEIVAEIQARRLNSPLDSVLTLTDAAGRQLAFNDDHEDKGSGLTTHQADSRLSAVLPATGAYFIHLGDAQRKGGTEYGYRLRLSPPRPDFELRVTPASLNARAGTSIPLAVYALRKDGFSGEITLGLKDPPAGFKLTGGRVTGTNEQVRLTLAVPSTPSRKPFVLKLEGRAKIGGQEVVRPAVPAEDMMQAFAYRHLVPVQDLMVAVIGRPRLAAPAKGPGKKAGPRPRAGRSKSR